MARCARAEGARTRRQRLGISRRRVPDLRRAVRLRIRAEGGWLIRRGERWKLRSRDNRSMRTRRWSAPPIRGRYSRPNITADEDSGLRCARNVAVWPDVETWLSHLH